MSEPTNLLTETLAKLAKNDHAMSDVRWVGSSDGKLAISAESFAEIAAQFNYDSGFGGQEVPTDLVVVGDGWWLERHEYDGSERWEYKTMPTRDPGAAQWAILRQDADCWFDLATANQPGGKYGDAL